MPAKQMSINFILNSQPILLPKPEPWARGPSINPSGEAVSPQSLLSLKPLIASMQSLCSDFEESMLHSTEFSEPGSYTEETSLMGSACSSSLLELASNPESAIDMEALQFFETAMQSGDASNLENFMPVEAGSSTSTSNPGRTEDVTDDGDLREFLDFHPSAFLLSSNLQGQNDQDMEWWFDVSQVTFQPEDGAWTESLDFDLPGPFPSLDLQDLNDQLLDCGPDFPQAKSIIDAHHDERDNPIAVPMVDHFLPERQDATKTKEPGPAAFANEEGDRRNDGPKDAVTGPPTSEISVTRASTASRGGQRRRPRKSIGNLRALHASPSLCETRRIRRPTPRPGLKSWEEVCRELPGEDWNLIMGL